MESAIYLPEPEIDERGKFPPDADQLVKEWMTMVTGDFNRKEYEKEINEVLFLKRHQGKQLEDYVNLLIDNIAFSIESEKRMLDLVEKILSEERALYFRELTQEMDRLREKLKGTTKPLAEELRETYRKEYETRSTRKNTAEREYARHYIAQNLLRDAIKVICNQSSLLRKLRKYAPKDIRNVFGYYLNVISTNLSKEIELHERTPLLF